MDACQFDHPPVSADICLLPHLFDRPNTNDPDELQVALRSFSFSSRTEIDGLRPGHLKDLSSSLNFEAR